MFWQFLDGLDNIRFTVFHQSQFRFYFPWIRAVTSLWSSSDNSSPNVQTETIWKFVSWPSSAPVSEEDEVLPHGFKRINLHGAASLFSVQKGKRLKEWNKGCCVHLAMIICCNLWVLFADCCDLTQWNGRGFCILFFVCVIPMSCESFLGTSEFTWAPAKNSDAQTLLEALILKDFFFQHCSSFFWDMVPFVGARAPEIPRDLVVDEYSQHSQKHYQGDSSIFCSITLLFSKIYYICLGIVQ